ncbi:DUF2270 domain-containing protein [Truepera radiovictrix]|uniref:DUF2270 domain-containing protein n=1 Tax=Truepera radiovictrix (strain DSM 17093 / CIP 108686 / LMG 22925 / RQ-24) TaxID=649638 RepID=D7CTR6_TRURR|nr:DUF2270 domain-containing protein [Truepera radiovictrix]ADI15613.1 conserved hypothetical protein [Truepera radiovictrix DSM 17093]WMT58758.1 DUF2270 domain-containing protein [Truepera radiovictrix]
MTPTKPPNLRDTNTVNSLIHLYRGELGRMALYRVRLDTTTNWAIVTNAGIVTFVLGNGALSHAALLFAMLLTLFFLTLEARRFRVYEVSHQRVRLFERGFFAEQLGATWVTDWPTRLLQSLEEPQPPISWASALGWRLRRNYLWLYAALVAAWVGKLAITSGEAVTGALQPLLAAARVGPLPGGAVWAAVGAFYVGLVLLALFGSQTYPLEAD